MGSTDPDQTPQGNGRRRFGGRLTSGFRRLRARLAGLPASAGLWGLITLAAAAVATQFYQLTALSIVLTVAVAGGAIAVHLATQRRLEDVSRREAKLPQATELEDLEARLHDRRDRLQQLERQLDDADHLLQRKREAEQWLRDNEPRLEQVERQRRQQEELEAENDRLRKQVESDTSRVRELAREAGDLEGRRDQARHQLDTTEQALEQARQKLDQLRRESETLESQRKQLAGETADLEDQQRRRDELQREADQLAEQRDMLRRERDEAERQRDRHREEAERLQQRAEQLDQRVHQADEQVESLNQRRASLGQEVAELESTAERHEQLRQELQQMTDRRAALSEQLAADESKREQLSEQLGQLRADLEQQQQTTQQLRDEAQELTERRNKLRGEVSELEPLSETYKQLKQKVEDLEQQSSRLSQQVASTEFQLSEKQDREKQLSEQLSESQHKLDELRRQVDALQQRHGSLTAEASESEKLRDRRDQQSEEIASELDRKRKELEATEQQLESQQQQRRQLREEVEGLTARKAQTEQTIETLDETLKEMRLQQGYRGSNAGPLSELWKPALRADAYTEPGDGNEDAWLQRMRGHLSSIGLHYADRTLRAFHTAMKVQDLSPLCVLAGLSGTGKSELARRYAEGMGMHFLNLAVQPRWDDPQDMFGFFNYLENQYRATELARALVQMDPFAGEEGRGWQLPEGWGHGLSNRMLVVLLDEMNLAHVEYYFSEFLSRLELRRGIDKTDPNDRRQAELALEIGAHGAGDPTMRLFVDTNVLFVGTINEDETTRTLSDKVIDRANMLSFGAPQELRTAGAAHPGQRPQRFLPYESWRQWIRDPEAMDREPGAQVEQWIDQLNEAMATVHRPLGFRTYSAIRAYAANYPDRSEAGLRRAMADQIEQKILPKFRGMDPTEESVGHALERVVELAEHWDDPALVRAIERSREEGARQYHFTFLGIDRSAETGQAEAAAGTDSASTEDRSGADGSAEAPASRSAVGAAQQTHRNA